MLPYLSLFISISTSRSSLCTSRSLEFLIYKLPTTLSGSPSLFTQHLPSTTSSKMKLSLGPAFAIALTLFSAGTSVAFPGDQDVDFDLYSRDTYDDVHLQARAAAAWEHGYTQGLAARDPDGDLGIFSGLAERGEKLQHEKRIGHHATCGQGHRTSWDDTWGTSKPQRCKTKLANGKSCLKSLTWSS